jgi:hypothetical protein
MSDFINEFLVLAQQCEGNLTRQFFDEALDHFNEVEEVEFIRWFKPMVAHLRLVEPEQIQLFLEEYYPYYEEMIKLKNSNLNYHD